MKKENKNFLYNVLYQVFTFIIPLITTPYISRVLGVDNVGIYSYTYSIVYYFMLITMLGINNYGSRTIAKSTNDNDKLSYYFCSIYYLQLFCGIVMLILYNILVLFVFKEYRSAFLIQNIYILSAIFDINWLYFGLEKFKITISRNVIIKLCSLIFIFLFVKTKSDLLIYIIIASGSTLLSQLYLWLFVKKNVKITKVKIRDIFKNFKPCLILFVPVVAYGIYRVMDKTMLGKISGTIVLGYYENAEKIINIPISFINALGTVMLPNISKIVNDSKELEKKIYASFKLCLFFVVPIFFGLLTIGKDFSVVFFGKDFSNSGIIIQYLSITIVFSAITNVIRTNYLIPKEMDKIYVSSTIIGAIINFIINLCLIPKYGYIGACIGTILAEFSVMLVQLLYVRKEINIYKIYKILLEYTLKSIIMTIFLLIIDLIIKNITLKIIFQIICGVLIYFALNYKFILYDFLNIEKNYLKRL